MKGVCLILSHVNWRSFIGLNGSAENYNRKSVVCSEQLFHFFLQQYLWEFRFGTDLLRESCNQVAFGSILNFHSKQWKNKSGKWCHCVQQCSLNQSGSVDFVLHQCHHIFIKRSSYRYSLDYMYSSLVIINAENGNTLREYYCYKQC